MIRKVINSHDIHINGQQLRIVHKNELACTVEGFNNIDLLLNEPRGSKYVNLIIYEPAGTVIDIEIHSNSVLDNKDILLKSFIQSLLERGMIGQHEKYTIREQQHTYTFTHDSLGSEDIHEVEGADGAYAACGKDVRVESVDFELSVENIKEIKNYVEVHEVFKGYLVLLHQEQHITVNEEKDILAYPVSEAVSVLNAVFRQDEIYALNGSRVTVMDGQYAFEQRLVSNSQFYIDESDIYSKGFVIK